MINFVCFLLGRIALTSAGAMLIPYLYTIHYENGATLMPFSVSIIICLSAMIFLFGKGEHHPERLNVTGGAAFLFSTWILYSFLGTFPYTLSGTLTFMDSLLECLSGFTTTGITGIEKGYAPDSIILWRSITQWLGGLNILLVLSAVVPAVTKGFGIFFAIPINLRQSAMTVAHIDKATRKVTSAYVTVTCIALTFFTVSGLNFFDSLNLAMVTISTGGCYQPEYAEINLWMLVIILFGLGASCLNVLIYLQSSSLAQIKKGLLLRLHSSELRCFIAILLICSTICTIDLLKNDFYNPLKALFDSIFFAASFASTTGIFTERMLDWPPLSKLIFMFLAILGGCMGSMAGGFKMLRLIILLKTSWAEMRRTLHPRKVISLKVDNGVVPLEVVRRVLSFFFLYCVIIFFSMMLISLSGCTMLQSMYIAIGCLTSAGQLILFEMTPNEIYAIPDFLKILCCFLMVLGKAEILSFLVLIQACIQQLDKKNW